MRTFGIEEEFFLVHPGTGFPAVPDQSTIASILGITAGANSSHTEMLACQVETATPICTDGLEALASLREYRKELARTVLEADLVAVGLGTIPQHLNGPAVIAENERYHQIQRFVPGISADQYVSGLHIHVGIPDSEAGIAALNALRPWLPLLTALGANSPFWHGRETGFSSWRTIHYRRWAVQGIQPHFGDAQDYDKRLATLLGTDALLDQGHIGWAARLSSRYPTVEIRIPDTQMRSEESVLLALIVRALVNTSLDAPAVSDSFLPEIMDIGLWQGAKHGLRGNQIDPATGRPVPTKLLLDRLLQYIRVSLDASGDTDFVHQGLATWAHTGNGAQRQRQSHARGGVRQVIRDAGGELTA